MSNIRSHDEGVKSSHNPTVLAARKVLLDTDGEIVVAQGQITDKSYNCVIFTSEQEDQEENISLTEQLMDEQTWIEFGKPTTITVTIEPGDRLNA